MAAVKRTLQSQILSRLQREPESRAITFLNHLGQHEWYSLGDFVGQASSYATSLSESGLEKGGVCVIVLSSGEESAKIVLACVLLGAVPLLVAPPSLQTAGSFSSLGQILKGVIARTHPDVVVVDEALRVLGEESAPAGGEHRAAWISVSDIDKERPAWEPRDMVSETDIPALQLTSGTTGFPKICVWQQRGVIAALDGMADAMRLTPQDLCLNWTPLYHDMGLVNNFLLCLVKGIPLGMIRPQDFVKNPSLWLRGLSDLGATVTWSPNFGFALAAQRCKNEDLAGVDLTRVRGFWSAAERIHFDTMMLFHERFRSYGVRLEALKTNFGCAENVGGATFSDPDAAFLFERLDRATYMEEGVAREAAAAAPDDSTITVVGAGKPYPGLGVQIVAEDGSRLPDGAIGEVALDTPSRMLEYLDNPSATASAIVGNQLRTGDMGYLRHGELFWVGRVQERINVRGVKIDPSDFEALLLNVEGLRPGCFAAFGLDDASRGTQRIAVVAEVRSSFGETSQALTESIRKGIFAALGLNVDDVVLVREGTLTKTSSGKRRHRFVKELYTKGQLTEHLWTPATEVPARSS